MHISIIVDLLEEQFDVLERRVEEEPAEPPVRPTLAETDHRY